MQISESFGAEATGVCGTRNLGLVRSLGADFVVDCTQEGTASKAEAYDLILAIRGTLPARDYYRVQWAATGVRNFHGAQEALLLSRATWKDLHNWGGIIIGAGVVLHLALHWKSIVSMTGNFLGRHGYRKESSRRSEVITG